MTLQRHARVQIDGLLAINPITGKHTDLLQYFAITRDVDGDALPVDAMWPTPGGGYPAVNEPIAMSRVHLR